MKNSINENGQRGHKAQGRRRWRWRWQQWRWARIETEILIEPAQSGKGGSQGGGGWLESYAAALANRKSMLPKICAEWQLRVLHVKSERGRGRWAAGEVAEFPLYLCPAAAASLCLMATRHTTRRKWLEKPAPTTRQMSLEAQEEAEEVEEEEPEEEPEEEREEEPEGEPEEEPE